MPQTESNLFLYCSNLTWNNLTGSVPQSLIEKVNKGTLSLRFTYTQIKAWKFHFCLLHFYFYFYLLRLKNNSIFLFASVDENPDLCLSSCTKDNHKKIIVAVVTTTLLSLVLLVAIVIFCKYRRTRHRGIFFVLLLMFLCLFYVFVLEFV